jgi:hypothetical protein
VTTDAGPRLGDGPAAVEVVDVPRTAAAAARARDLRTRRLALGGFAVLAVLMTFPDLRHLRTHVAGDHGDAMLNLWTLDWVWHTLPQGWSTLWRGQLFQPGSRTLAYSEAMIPQALVFGLLRLVVRSDATAFNLTSLLAWTASLYWSWRLFRRWTPSDAAAALGAVAWTFSAVRLAQLGHFQLGAGCLVPLVILCALRFVDEPTIRRGLALGGVLALTTLSASYYGITVVMATAVVLVGPFVARRTRPERAHVVGLLAGATLPVAYEYARLQRDPAFRRSAEPGFSTHLQDFGTVADGMRVVHDVPFLRGHVEGSVERALYPGVVTTVLAAAGLVVVLRRRGGVRRLELAVLGVAGLVLFVVALGDRLEVGGVDVPMPYRVLRKVVPGFDGVRVTARFSIVWQLALAAFAVVGATALVRRLGPRRGAVACALLGVVVLAESSVDVALVRLPDAPAWTAVNHELAHRPDGLVLELPIRLGAELNTRTVVESPREYLARIDDHQRVNGYSGFDPPDYDARAFIFNGFPSTDALAQADDMGVRYVVIRTNAVGYQDPAVRAYLDADGVGSWDDALAQQRISQIPPDRVANVGRYGEAWLVELRPRQPA